MKLLMKMTREQSRRVVARNFGRSRFDAKEVDNMALTRWDPFRDFMALEQELGRIFERTLSPGEQIARRSGGFWTPAIDVYERDAELIVKAELPGIKAEDVEVTVEDDTLSIKGERKQTEEVKEEHYYRVERRYGSFERLIPLSTTVSKDAIKATFKDGVLEVSLPKAEEAKAKRVKIAVATKG